MHLSFDKLFPKKSPPSLRVRTKRNLILTDLSGQSRNLTTGEELEISDVTARQLDRDDIEVLSSTTKAKTEHVADPTPPRPSPNPIPEAWKPLPECFKTWWDIKEDFRISRLHIEQIREARIEVFGTNTSIFGNPDVSTVIVNRLVIGKPNENVVYHARVMDLTDPAVIRLEQYLVAAENAAEDYLGRLKDVKSLPLQRAYLDCGFHRLRICEELDQEVQEAARIGFALFSLRVSPLGLAEVNARKLYSGSADYLKYTLTPAGFGQRVSAGYDEAGILRVFSDDEVSGSACMSIREADRLKAAKALVAEGRKHLSRAEKVMNRTSMESVPA